MYGRNLRLEKPFKVENRPISKRTVAVGSTSKNGEPSQHPIKSPKAFRIGAAVRAVAAALPLYLVSAPAHATAGSNQYYVEKRV